MGLVLVAAGAWGGESEWASYTFESMSTRVDVVLPAGRPDGVALVEAAFDRVEEVANEWRPGSPLAEVNAGAGGPPVAVPADLVALGARSLEVAIVTEGAFDPTWAALWGLWDVRAAAPVVPDPAEVAAAAARVDYRCLEVNPDAQTLRLVEPECVVGLGGIAKGWALDRAAASLRAVGIESFTLSAGGQVYAGGTRGERAWRVGVRDPRGDPTDALLLLEVRDVSVSTSGDYERYFIQGGVRYHHILDPRTGWPARGTRSATVVAADATLADALSTALMVLGPDRGLALAERLPGVEALTVGVDGAVAWTSGLAPILLHDPLPDPLETR